MGSNSSTAFWANGIDEYEAADRLRDFFANFSAVQSSRRSLAEKYATVVEGMTLTSLGPWGYSYECEVATFEESDIPIIRNVAHSLVHTLTSKIGAIDPPLPSMLTNKGSWRDRRQASDLEQLVRAEYCNAKGLHATLHQLWIAALRIAAGATGAVAVQFYADQGNVGARIHDTLDMAWSPDLRTQSSVTWLPVDDVVEMYPDSEVEIRASVGEPPPEWRTPTRNGEKLVDFVCVYEGYRGANGNKPGKKVVCVGQGGALEVSEYPHKKPPFVWLRCIEHLYGPLGHSFVHFAYESMKRDNLILSRIDRAINKTNESTVYVAQGSLANDQVMSETADRKVIWVQDATKGLPVTVSAPGFAPEHLQVADRHYQDVHAITGLSEMHTGGVHQPGVDSAIGQRYVAALVNERFASLQRAYIQAVAVDSAEMIIQTLCEIFEDDSKLMRLAPGQDTLKEISGKVALKGIEQLKYVVQPAAVSGNKGSPADRVQSAFELKQLGALSDAQFASIQSGQGLDLPEETDDADIQRQWLEREMYRWMYASDEDVAKPDFYRPPFEHFELDKMLLQVVDGYAEASMDDLEPERLDFFFRFIADCAALMPEPPQPAPGPLPVVAA